MAAQILVPKLGMSTAPLTLIEWKAKEGDLVEQGSIVLVVETEKIRHDVEAEISGFLHILIEEGREVPIGTVAGLIAETKEELEALQKEKPSEVSTAAELKEAPPVEVAIEDLPVYRPEPDRTKFDITHEPDGGWRVSGAAVERAAEMTYWEYEEAVRRFQGLLVRLGVEDALRKDGAQSGDTVRIGKHELEWLD